MGISRPLSQLSHEVPSRGIGNSGYFVPPSDQIEEGWEILSRTLMDCSAFRGFLCGRTIDSV
jgi:hypothetical protein